MTIDGTVVPAALPVERITAQVVALPLEDGQAIATTLNRFTRHHFVVVTLDSHDMTGIGYAWTTGEAEARAITELVLHVGESLLGADARDVEANWAKMLFTLRLWGRTGLGMVAVSALDTCLLDLLGKAAQQPLWRLLGAAEAGSAPCYASGCFLSSSVGQLREEAARALDEGYDIVKMRVGKPTGEEDVARVRAVREVLGDDTALILDAVLAWDKATAIKRIASLAQFDPYWIEDPVDYDEGVDYGALLEVGASTTIPITAGEFVCGLPAFRAGIDARAASILMLDIQHLGGLTGCLKLCQVARSAGQPLTGHFFIETMVHLHAVDGWSTPLEWVPWSTALFTDAPRPERGRLKTPTAPGLGYTLDEEVVARHSLGRREIANGRATDATRV